MLKIKNCYLYIITILLLNLLSGCISENQLSNEPTNLVTISKLRQQNESYFNKIINCTGCVRYKLAIQSFMFYIIDDKTMENSLFVVDVNYTVEDILNVGDCYTFTGLFVKCFTLNENVTPFKDVLLMYEVKERE